MSYKIVEKRVKEVNTYHVYLHNCLTKYIMHLKSAIEGATTLFTCTIFNQKKILEH